MFQDLHSQRENGVSKMITISIRCHLYKDVHNNEKDAFISKYLLIVSINKMASHRVVKFFESHDWSGHSLGNNQEKYLDRNIIALNLPGAYDLNGWVDANPKKSNPTFYWLEPHVMEQANCLIKELYIVSVTQLKRDGSIYPVILEATYSTEMYHRSVGTHIGHKNKYTKAVQMWPKIQNQGFQQS